MFANSEKKSKMYSSCFSLINNKVTQLGEKQRYFKDSNNIN